MKVLKFKGVRRFPVFCMKLQTELIEMSLVMLVLHLTMPFWGETGRALNPMIGANLSGDYTIKCTKSMRHPNLNWVLSNFLI